MNLKKSVFRCFVSVMLLFSMLFGLTLPAFATGRKQEKSTQYIQTNSATKELIEKTISELTAKGKVYTPKTDKALDLKVKETSGLSLGAVKTSILFDLFSNDEAGRIDTAKFGLDTKTLEKVLDMTLKEFALESAVDIVKIDSDDNGIAIDMEFEMRSSFKAGLDEFSSEPETLNSDENRDSGALDNKGGTNRAAVTVTVTEVNDAPVWEAGFNWNYRYVEDKTNGVGLVFRDDKIQAATKDEQGYFQTKIEFYLESITLTPLQTDGNSVPDPKPVILDASEGTVSTEGNITTITYPNGLKVEDLFVDGAYLNSLQTKLNAELEKTGDAPPNDDALLLINQLNALGPCIYSHILTASFTDPENYPSYDEKLDDVYTETINATELAVYQYYAELCSFNKAFPQHFGSAANFWTSKDSSSSGTPILGALKTLANMQPDTFVPFGAYDANGDGELDMQTEMGLDFLISMLAQAFMAYEQQLGGLLDAKINDCRQQIKENMTTEQKMLAIHDWLANNAEFDIGIITAMKDGTSGGSDPAQMTAFGTLLYDPLRLEGAICLGYAATYYLLLQEVMGLDTEENDIVMVRWWADISETSVAGPDSGFGQGRFNETHYFNAVKLGDEWYYIDACYDDIYCEVMTQYRVETDGNISHNYFLFSPTNALNMFDGNLDYIDSAYDGVTFQRRLKLDEQGNVQYKNMSPVYVSEPIDADHEHVIWYHSAYPESAQDADDATNAYLDTSIKCNETTYSDTQYEKSWFTAAIGEIHNDGTYYYYVAGDLNSYAAMSGDDLGSGQMGDNDVEADLGAIFNSDDPSFADRLVRRKMNDPVNATQDKANEDNWTRQVEIEFTMNGGQPMTGNRDVFVDPYTETIFHYGYGTLGQPRLGSDKMTPLLGDDGNFINDKTGEPLLEEYADIIADDKEFRDTYPDLAHTSGVHDGKLYFNVANQIYSLSIADIADWHYTIDLLKEYNTVHYFSDGKDFGNEKGSRFTGKTFHLTSDPDQAIGTMTGKPIAAISLEDRWEATQQGINYHPTLTVSIGTNLSESTKDDNGKSYRVEAVDYNPDYITGYSSSDENSNVEFMWSANLVEDLLMSDFDGAKQTISYNSNTGSGTMVNTKGDTGSSITLSENTFTKAGYTFTGWNTAADGSGESYADKTSVMMPDDGLTLYAQWAAAQQTIIYNSNTGSGTIDVTTGNTDASVTLSENTFTKSGYTFSGWNTAADGSGTKYADQDSIKMPAGGLTLYAQWTAVQQTISYDNNTGLGTMDATTGNTDASVTLSENTFTKSGYTFTGWNTAADGSGTGHADKTPITMPAGGLTLYAQWTAVQQTIKDEVIGGANRYETAVLISQRLYDSAETVILTTGIDFPDALSAGPLAVQVNAPILLSDVNTIPAGTLAEIKRLEAKKVIILGGEMAIALSVETTLKDLDINVERISGATRILTAIETAKKVRSSSGQLEKAILVNGYDFADALSIGSNAAKAGIPILLTTPKALSPETKQAILDFGIKEIEIIGGDLAVSEAIADELKDMGITVSRISGANRFGTSAAVAGQYFAESQNVIISTGRGFADALAVVPLAVKQNAPILLVENNSLPTEISDYLDGSITNNITIVGGELAVSSLVRDQILDVLK